MVDAFRTSVILKLVAYMIKVDYKIAGCFVLHFPCVS